MHGCRLAADGSTLTASGPRIHSRPASQARVGWGRRMNVVLWIVQVLVALAFLAHGLMMLFPPAEIAQQMNATMPRALSLFIGGAEALAGIGLTVPAVTRIRPHLVAWAAAGLIPIMIGATVFHIARGEASAAITTAILLAMATFVAYMRWKVLPIAPRGAVAARSARSV